MGIEHLQQLHEIGVRWRVDHHDDPQRLAVHSAAYAMNASNLTPAALTIRERAWRDEATQAAASTALPVGQRVMEGPVRYELLSWLSTSGYLCEQEREAYGDIPAGAQIQDAVGWFEERGFVSVFVGEFVPGHFLTVLIHPDGLIAQLQRNLDSTLESAEVFAVVEPIDTYPLVLLGGNMTFKTTDQARTRWVRIGSLNYMPWSSTQGSLRVYLEALRTFGRPVLPWPG